MTSIGKPMHRASLKIPTITLRRGAELSTASAASVTSASAPRANLLMLPPTQRTIGFPHPRSRSSPCCPGVIGLGAPA